MALGDDIQASFESVKRKLEAEQVRLVISRDIMPFQYANGRVMFNADKTRSIVRGSIEESPRAALVAIADAMLDIKELSALTVGYVRNTKLEYVFIFVHLQD